MDIFAHAMWAGTGVVAARRRWPVATRTLILTVILATLPDLFQLLPIMGWWILGDAPLAALRDYAAALPGPDPSLPPMVSFLSQHLHCIAHSALVAGAVTWLVWVAIGSFWMPLVGWWSHIIIDVFTHSKDFYPSPVFYPITLEGFDGIAWNTPWFMVLNYAALGACALWLLCQRTRHGSA